VLPGTPKGFTALQPLTVSFSSQQNTSWPDLGGAESSLPSSRMMQPFMMWMTGICFEHTCKCPLTFLFLLLNTEYRIQKYSHTGICPKHLKIPSFPSQYILSLLLFLVNNKNKFKFNSRVCNINTAYKYKFHHSSWNLSLYQKGVYLIAVKVFTTLPQNIKNFSDKSKQFTSDLKII
jgi:hypothetical protein